MDNRSRYYRYFECTTRGEYKPRLGRKYIPPMHVDLGQGMLQVIEEVEQNLKDEKVNKKSNI